MQILTEALVAGDHWVSYSRRFQSYSRARSVPLVSIFRCYRII